ncbi:MAG: formylglycine-generating enzyme family protein [Spirochaetes bacterium]|nr:formylglycine-generating enzyme family protein [Spirochaetota bacterium]
MFHIDDYILFHSGEIEIGIDPSAVDKIYSSQKYNLRKEYIAASSPRKKITYNEFNIKKKLITVNEFSEFIADTSYITESERDGWGWGWSNRWIKKEKVSWRTPFLDKNDEYYISNSEIFPVMQVSWNDAVEYTDWLSIIYGEKFRLPIEYEWEVFGNFAGADSIVSALSGRTESDTYTKVDSDDIFIHALEQKIMTSEFQLGLLWEWTLDWYKGYDGSIVNKDFGDIYKILRGGSLLSDNIQRSKEFRFRRCPTARSPYYGFRIVYT